MNFTKIRLDGRTNIDFVVFGMRPTTRYMLKEASGLGPPEIEVSMDHGSYIKREPLPREIVLRVGLNPDYSKGETVGLMRDTLYGLLSPRANDSIDVKIMNGDQTLAKAKGYVKRIEIVPFSKDPEIQITIACLSAYLQAPEDEFWKPTRHQDFVINNRGSVTTGFYMELKFNDDRDHFSLRPQPHGQPRLQLNYDFHNNDLLKIRTTKDGRWVYIVRGGQNHNIIKALTSDSTWLEAHPGENHFWAEPVAATDWKWIIYTPLFWGI